MSAKERDAQFNKLVDRFALELSNNDKQRLVHVYDLAPHYYSESSIVVMDGLKMIGKYSSKNPEGLLDIAEFLERKDLTEKFMPMIQELKKTKLRKASSAVSLDHLYSIVDLGQSLDIAVGQIELGRASSEVLQKICTHRRPQKKRRLSEHFDEAMQKLESAVAAIREVEQLMLSDSPQVVRRPIPEENTSILEKTSVDLLAPQQETYEPIYENVGRQTEDNNKIRKAKQTPHPLSLSAAASCEDLRKPVRVLPTIPSKKPANPNKTSAIGSESPRQQQGSIKVPLIPPRSRESPLRSRKETVHESPPPNPRPKPTSKKPIPLPTAATAVSVAVPRDHIEVQYDVPIGIPSGDRTSGTFGSDSGFTGDWPEPKTKPKSGYQALLRTEEEPQYNRPM